MLRLMDEAESLSTTDWKLLTDVLLLGLAESGHRDTETKGHRDTGKKRHRDTETQGHVNEQREGV